MCSRTIKTSLGARRSTSSTNLCGRERTRSYSRGCSPTPPKDWPLMISTVSRRKSTKTAGIHLLTPLHTHTHTRTHTHRHTLITAISTATASGQKLTRTLGNLLWNPPSPLLHTCIHADHSTLRLKSTRTLGHLLADAHSHKLFTIKQ